MGKFGQFEILLTVEFALLITFIFVNLWNITIFIVSKFRPKKEVEENSVKKIASTSDFTVKKKKLWAISALPIKSKIKVPRLRLKAHKPNLIRLMIFNIILTASFLGILYYLFNPGAKILSTYPLSNQALLDYEKPIEIVFDRPIRKDVLEIYMSNNIAGEWEYVKSFSFLPFVRVVRFYPKESFFPGELIKMYIVNFNKKDIGEYPLDFYSAELPEITSVTPIDKQRDLFPDQKIIVTMNKRQGNYVNWEFKLSPETEVTIEQKSPIEFILTPVNGLKQTTEYTLEIYRIPQTFNLDTDEVIKTGEKVKVHESRFFTVKAPLVESYTPEGSGVLPSATVKVVFDEPMIHEEVENAFSIEPNITGQITWLDERTFEFKPNELTRETKYKVTFAKGLHGETGGTTESDITFEFETVGSVKVIGYNPGPGAGSVDINASVSVVFDQQVDHASAQSHFSIAPNIAGTFSWNGNTMVYKPSSPLAYSTTYAINVTPGVISIYGYDSKQTFSSSFTTRPAEVILNVPFRYQIHSFGCNSAATAMAMTYKGVSVSESQVYNGAGAGPQAGKGPAGGFGGGNPHVGWVPDYGVYWGPISQYVSSRGLSNTVYQGWSLTGALQEVQNGNPVVIWWQNGVSAPTNISWTAADGQYVHAVNGMHSVVIVGFRGTPESPTLIYYHDPYFGANRTLSPSAFDSRWATWRMGSVPAGYSRVGMVVR